MKIATNQIARKARFLFALTATGVLFLAAASPAAAAPVWRIDSFSNTTVQPGDILDYMVRIKNVGDEPTNGSPIMLTVDLPEGLSVADPAGPVSEPSNPHFFKSNFTLEDLVSFGETHQCTGPDGVTLLTGGEMLVRCEDTSIMTPKLAAHFQNVFLPVRADPDLTPGETLTTQVEVEGGGAAVAKTVDPVRVSAAPPGFGIDAFDVQLTDGAGGPMTQAGGHPGDITTYIDFNSIMDPRSISGPLTPAEPVRDIFVDLPAGFVGNPTGLEQCTTVQLANTEGVSGVPLCPAAAQIGTFSVRASDRGFNPSQLVSPAFNMVPPPGVPARFGFNFAGTVVTLDVELHSDNDYRLSVGSRGISEGLAVTGVTTTFWGRPASHSHDSERACPGGLPPSVNGPICSGGSDVPFLRNPASCSPGKGLDFPVRSDSWFHPGDFVSTSTASHDLPGYPAAPGEWGPDQEITGCENVPVKGSLKALPTTIDTESPSGLAVHVEVPNPGLENPDGIASSDIKAVKVALPQGITINPSQAEGLGVCTPAQYESTELSFYPTPGKGCPDDSKIGTVEVKTPLLDEAIPGDVFIAQQDDPTTSRHGAENPFDSLLALYIVLHEPERGILIKLPGKVEPDEKSGRIVTTFDDLPQLPFSTFDFHFREGARAPLVTPPACGKYTTEAEFTPWSDPSHKLQSNSSFEIVHGIGGGSCPSGGVPPFEPGFSAGSINPNAGSYSPFSMRLTRQDGEQDMTKFSSVLPPGVSAKIAGVAKCPEAAILAAPRKTGREELTSPSCPANSQIGRSLAGAGVGSVLTYVPGQIYLAGPYNGAPLSAVAITPAVAGPFDVGTVVVREALTLDPKTAEVRVDGDKSDPIPHILEGIPLKLRDLRVYVDRPDFTINPTSCDPSAVAATLFGSNADIFNPADDVPVALSSRFQAANCAALGFKPKLSLNLTGGTKRGGHPALKAVLNARRGDANLGSVSVTLPKSAFLDQAHIGTICTRVQFAAKACPTRSIYGDVRAFTPLLDEPLEGPVYLRSSNHKLPDLVMALHGIVDIEVAGRIDSVKLGSGSTGIRSSFETVPDAPVSRVVLEMQGGKKGLLQNSQNLCRATNRANVEFIGQNGKARDFKPVVKPSCGKGRRGKK